MLKLREAESKSTSWDRPAVQSMLTQKAIDPADLEPFKGASNPGSKGAANPAPNGAVNPYDENGAKGGSKGGPTNAFLTNATAIEIPPNDFPREPSPRRAEGAELARANFANLPARSLAAHQIAQAFSASLPVPVESGLQAEIATQIDKCLRDSIPPPAIADGLRAWAASDSWHPSQIPKFVMKAAAAAIRHPTPGVGKPTQKAMGYDQLAEELIAEISREEP